LPAVNALSTRDGVGVGVHPSVVVGARAIWSVLVLLISAATATHERRLDRTGAVFRLDHLGRNPKLFVGLGSERPVHGRLVRRCLVQGVGVPRAGTLRRRRWQR
jgi:hypothetical protein